LEDWDGVNQILRSKMALEPHANYMDMGVKMAARNAEAYPYRQASGPKMQELPTSKRI
jgi:hypothetical protein